MLIPLNHDFIMFPRDTCINLRVLLVTVTFMLTMMVTMYSSTNLVGATESDLKFLLRDPWGFLLKLGLA